MNVNLICVAGVALALAGCGSEEPRTVPDVRGERLDVAEERLDRLGLAYEEVGGGSFGIVVKSNWRVCRQEPAPGAEATTVRLIVDRSCPAPPPKRVVLPDLVGDPLEAAESELEAEGLEYALRSWAGGPVVRAGARVCDQEPDAGRKASRVTLFVAAACDPAPAAPQVPAVVGLDLGAAVDILESLGIGYDTSSSEADVEAFFDVCAQDPAAGSRSATVVLHVERDC